MILCSSVDVHRRRKDVSSIPAGRPIVDDFKFRPVCDFHSN